MPPFFQSNQISGECLKRFGPELYDIKTAPLSLKVGMLKAEVIETLLYGCVTWTLSHNNSPGSDRCITKSSCGSLASSADSVATI